MNAEPSKNEFDPTTLAAEFLTLKGDKPLPGKESKYLAKAKTVIEKARGNGIADSKVLFILGVYSGWLDALNDVCGIYFASEPDEEKMKREIAEFVHQRIAQDGQVEDINGQVRQAWADWQESTKEKPKN